MADEVERAAWSFSEWCEKRRGFSVGTGYNLVRQGKLKITKIGALSFVTAAEDARYTKALEAEGDTPFRAISEQRRNAYRENEKSIKAASAAARGARKPDPKAAKGKR